MESDLKSLSWDELGELGRAVFEELVRRLREQDLELVPDCSPAPELGGMPWRPRGARGR